MQSILVLAARIRAEDTLFVTVERDFDEPSEPPVVLFNVRMEA